MKKDKPGGSRRTVKHFLDKLSPIPTRTWSGLEDPQEKGCFDSAQHEAGAQRAG